MSLVLIGTAGVLNAPLLALALGASGSSGLAVGFVAQVAIFILVWNLVARLLTPWAGRLVLVGITVAYLVATVLLLVSVKFHV